LGGDNIVRKSETRQSIQGKLDPAAPVLFLVNANAPKGLKISAPTVVKSGATLEINLKSDAGSEACLFRVQLSGPNGFERACYANFSFAANGSLNHRVPMAFNDPAGKWQINVVDLLHGAESSANFELKSE
jgi:hypothetical protein